MEIVKFMKLDLRKILQQYKLLVLFAVVSVVLTVCGNVGNWGLLYMGFAGLILSTSPLFADKLSERGFYNLLPAHDGSRVRGRFLAGTLFILLTSVTGLAIMMICDEILGNSGQYVSEYFLMVCASGILFNGIQYFVLSLMKTKNPQILGVIRIIPGFIMLFGGSYLQSLMTGEDAPIPNLLTDMIEYVMNHMMFCCWIFLGAALVLNVILAEIVVLKEK